jgi:drug/metabolite transporter (DMT)-like permease
LGVYVTVCYGTAAGYLCLAAISTGQPMVGFSTSTWWYLIALALVSQILGHTTNNWALRFFSASMIAVALMGEPICSTLLAYFLFDETLTVIQVGGAMLILVGIYLAASAERRRC